MYNKQEETYHICTYIANYSIAAGHYLQQTYPYGYSHTVCQLYYIDQAVTQCVLCMREGIVGEREARRGGQIKDTKRYLFCRRGSIRSCGVQATNLTTIGTSLNPYHTIHHEQQGLPRKECTDGVSEQNGHVHHDNANKNSASNLRSTSTLVMMKIGIELSPV